MGMPGRRVTPRLNADIEHPLADQDRSGARVDLVDDLGVGGGLLVEHPIVEPARVITQGVSPPGLGWVTMPSSDIEISAMTLLIAPSFSGNVFVSALDARKGSGIVGSGSSHMASVSPSRTVRVSNAPGDEPVQGHGHHEVDGSSSHAIPSSLSAQVAGRVWILATSPSGPRGFNDAGVPRARDPQRVDAPFVRQGQVSDSATVSGASTASP